MRKQTSNRYPLALNPEVMVVVRAEAKQERRTLNAELGLLIEEGLKWREMRKANQAAA